MAFPDRIERTVDLDHPPERVWAALTTVEGLNGWFGDRSEVDLRPGGLIELHFDAEQTTDRLRVEVVEPCRRLGFTWSLHSLPADDPRRTYVEFLLEPTDTGTRLTVVETGFAQLPDDAHARSYSGNREGWTKELADLVAYLDTA
jgi:uncharacterized protein YndB with AHSA1/START domain